MSALGLDLDGVLYNWHLAVYEYYKLFKSYVGTYGEFWGIYYKNISKEEWDFLCQVDTLYSNVPPTDDCIDFLDYVKYRYDVYYITSRPLLVKLTTEQFLRRYKFPFRENLVFTSDKVNESRRLHITNFLDDNPIYIEGLSKITNTILIANPWNSHLWDTYNTAHSLKSAIKFLEE